MIQSYGVVQRRAVRRAVRARCQVVSSQGFELIGEALLDVSPGGAMLACDVPVALGESLVMAFRAPGEEPVWIDAEAVVARVIYGYRTGDPGYCAGLRFTYLERPARHELLSRLAGLPPPIPQRHPEQRGERAAGVRILLPRRIRTPLPRGAFS
jgi:hypothetical protein